MDENQIGQNMNTTPVQRYVRSGPYPSGKAVPLQLEILGSNPVGVTCRAGGKIRDTMGQFLFLFFLPFFCFDFVPFVGDPRECRGDVAFPPTCGPPKRHGLGIQF